MSSRTGIARNLIRVAVVVSTVAALGGCATIPQRAWANGQAMSQSRANRAAMSGDMSLQTHRKLSSSASPLRLRHREVAYPPFGHWYW